MRRQLVSVLVLVVLAPACGGSRGAPGDDGGVVAAFYPLAWAAEAVAGDALEVTDLTPPGAEPHDLELTPGQVRDVAGAALVVYVGGGFQPAVEELARERPDAALDVLGEEHGSAAADEEHGHDHGAGDPHVWLDPVAMADVVDDIGERLGRVAPDAAGTIKTRTREVTRDLEALHDEFDAGLARCERRDFVVSHAAFGHLAARYDLEQIAISGLDPEAEPSPGRIAEVTRIARDRGVTTIFFETLVSPAVAETIADEAGLETAMLDPLESRPADGDYADAMRANLAALRRALECS